MGESSKEREEEIDSVFSGTLPLIQMALVHYRLRDAERRSLERDIRLWFQRLVSRIDNDQTPVAALRKYLLLASCQFAYAYQSRRASKLPADPRLAEVLARNPRVVAVELQKMLEPEIPGKRETGARPASVS